MCGQPTPCSVFLTKNPYISTFTSLYSWTFTVVAGHNQLFLPQLASLVQGNFVRLTQTTAKLSIDSSEATYSDLFWNPTINMWSPLTPSSNWKFYLNLVSTSCQKYYQSQLNINHKYSSAGFYLFSLTIGSTVYSQTVRITDCKYGFN